MEKLFTVLQVAELLSLSPSTIRRWLWDGRLPRVKVGRATRVREGDLLALIRLGLRGEKTTNRIGRPREESGDGQ